MSDERLPRVPRRHHRPVPAQHDPSPWPSDPSTRAHGRRRGATASPERVGCRR